MTGSDWSKPEWSVFSRLVALLVVVAVLALTASSCSGSLLSFGKPQTGPAVPTCPSGEGESWDAEPGDKDAQPYCVPD